MSYPVYIVDTLEGSPACCNRFTGEVFLAKDVCETLPYTYVVFIILHECAHIEIGTTDESRADSLAFYRYAALGLPLSDAVFALTKILNCDISQSNFIAEHEKRINDQYNRVLWYDANINKYPLSIKKYKDLQKC